MPIIGVGSSVRPPGDRNQSTVIRSEASSSSIIGEAGRLAPHAAASVYERKNIRCGCQARVHDLGGSAEHVGNMNPVTLLHSEGGYTATGITSELPVSRHLAESLDRFRWFDACIVLLSTVRIEILSSDWNRRRFHPSDTGFNASFVINQALLRRFRAGDKIRKTENFAEGGT